MGVILLKSKDNGLSKKSLYIFVGFAVLIFIISQGFIKHTEDDSKDVIITPKQTTFTMVSSAPTVSQTSDSKADVSVTKSKSDTQKTFKQKSKNRKSTTTTQSVNFPIDINKAEYWQLIQIDGIGSKTASAIIDYRNSIGVIYNLGLLENVRGIGAKTIEKLSRYLYVSDYDYRPIDNQNDNNPVHTEVSEQQENNQPQTIVTTTLPVRNQVNINTANAQEISANLLIDMELAEKIVALRNEITYFSNPLELLYIDGMSESLYNEIAPYVLL